MGHGTGWTAKQMMEHRKNCKEVKTYCNDCQHFGRGYCMVGVGDKRPEFYTDDFIMANCKES